MYIIEMFKYAWNLLVQNMAKDIIAQLSKIRENELKNSISNLFKPKQKEIIFKVLNEEPLTKTEAEYYSRIIKKKLEAITALNDMANMALRKQIRRGGK